MITERLLANETGYNKNQIRRRRQNHWIEGLHYWKDEAGAMVYNREEIQRWQEMTRGSTSTKASAESFGTVKVGAKLNSSTYNGLKVVARRPQESESKSSEMNI